LLIHSADFVDNFRDWCGTDCYNKHLPPFASKSDAALAGLIDSDGFRGKNETVLTTVSGSLALQVFNLHLTEKNYPSMRVHQSDYGFPHGATTYQIATSSGAWHYTRWWRYQGRDYYLMPIVSIKSRDYKGSVYNLSVQDQHAYLANGIICHNCTEGGILYGAGIHGVRFKEWLESLENNGHSA